jgi:hypothetical protein
MIGNSAQKSAAAGTVSLALPAAERRLMVTPSAYPDQLWQKLEAFEAILGDEIMSGPRRDCSLDQGRSASLMERG